MATTPWIQFNATTQTRNVDGVDEYRLIGVSPKPPFNVSDEINKKVSLIGEEEISGLKTFLDDIAIGSNVSGAPGSPGVLISRELTLGAENSRGFRDNSTFTTSDMAAYASFDAGAKTVGTDDVNHIVGFQSRVAHNSIGTLLELAGFTAVLITNGGEAAEAWGFRSSEIVGTGEVIDCYGLLVLDPNKGNNRYGVKLEVVDGPTFWNIFAGTDAKNHLNGNTSIGDVTDTGEKLQVYGTFKVTGQSTLTGQVNIGTRINMSTPASSSGPGDFGYNATVGSYYWTKSGSSNDYTVFNNAGNPVLVIPAGTDTLKAIGKLNVGSTTEYTDNAAAISGGLVVGDVYRTGDLLKIVH